MTEPGIIICGRMFFVGRWYAAADEYLDAGPFLLQHVHTFSKQGEQQVWFRDAEWRMGTMWPRDWLSLAGCEVPEPELPEQPSE